MHAKLFRSMQKSCGSHEQDSIKMDVGELHRRDAEQDCEWSQYHLLILKRLK